MSRLAPRASVTVCLFALAANVLCAPRGAAADQVRMIATGNHHTCTVTSDGAVLCWGRNQYGQLGNGTNTDSSKPVPVAGLPSGALTVSTRGDHTCALTTAGGVKCWGFNAYGQLGDGSTVNRSTPVDVLGLATGTKTIAVGSDHTCAIDAANALKCWGLNQFGQVGNGTTSNSWLGPVMVTGLTSEVTGVSAGGLHTCAVISGGALKCWGSNFNGQLGIGQAPTAPPDQAQCTNITYLGCRAIPVDIILGASVSQVSAGGAETCALLTTGGVKCWGYNAFGQSGNGTRSQTPPNYPQPGPVDVVGLPRPVATVRARNTTCVVDAMGALCWGSNDVGQIGDGTSTGRSTPVRVTGLGNDVRGIDTGRHTCAWTAAGAAKCWGANNYGQLGNGMITGQFQPNPLPVDVVFPPAVTTYDVWIGTEIDRINGTICPRGSEIAYVLSAPATVTIVINGQVVQQASLRPAGANAFPIDPIALSLPGEHPFTISAVFDVGGVATTLTASATVHHDVRLRAAFPVGHTIVKGVDIHDGHLTHTAQDVLIPGRGLSLELTRTYSSAGTASDGPLGGGWTHNYNSRIVHDTCGRYVVVGGEGTGNAFVFDGTVYRPQIGYHSTLVRDPQDSGRFDFFTKAHVRYRFERELTVPGEVYTLRFIEEPNGNRLTLDYVGGDGDAATLDRVTDSSGRSLVFSYSQVLQRKRIQQITGATLAATSLLNLRITYEYDVFGNLIRVTRKSPDPAANLNDERVQIYDYTPTDPRDRYNMRAYTDPNGHTTTYGYFALNDTIPGAVAFGVLPQEIVRRVQEPENVAVEFGYNFTEGTRTVSNPRAPAEPIPATKYQLNGYGATVRIEAPLDRITILEWCTDAPSPACPGANGSPGRDALLISEIDPEGRTTRYEYDARGNMTRTTVSFTGNKQPVTLTDGTTPVSQVTSSFTYDPMFGRVTSKTDPEGHTTVYQLDAPGSPPLCADQTPGRDTGNLLGTRDAAGAVACYAYAPNGDLAGVIDARGIVISYPLYDPYGNRLIGRDALGNVTNSVFDERSRLREVTDTFTHHVRYTYDGLDRQIRQELLDDNGANGTPRVMTQQYRPGGELERQEDGLGHVTRYVYDQANRLSARHEESVRDADGTTATLSFLHTYDAAGNTRTETDARGVQRLHTYDALDRRTRTEVRGSFGPDQTVLVNTYDRVGNRLTETDLHGHATTYVHDGLYRVVRTVLPFPNAVTRTAYDRLSNKVVETDADGHSTRYAYDAVSRLKTVTDALGRRVTLEYDAVGNKTREVDETTALVTEYGPYDALNRPTRIKETGPGLPPAGNLVVFAYDDSRNAIVQTDARGAVTRTVKDGLDRTVQTTTAAGALDLMTRLTYDANGNVATVRDPEGDDVDVTHEYDGLNRRIRSTYVATPDDGGLPVTEAFSYDGNDNLVAYQDKRGTIFTATYDNLNRILATTVRETVTNGGMPLELTAHTYNDASGSEMRRDANGNTTTVHYDGLHRERIVDDPTANAPFNAAAAPPFPAGIRWFDYDAANQRAEVDGRGLRREFDYDAAHRLIATREYDAAGALKTAASTEYLDSAREIRDTDRRGGVTRRQFDARRRPIAVWRSGLDMVERYGSAEVVMERSEYDGNGNVTARVDAGGNRTEFGYDAANRQTTITEGAGTSAAGTVLTTYDGAGNVLTLKDARPHGGSFDTRDTYDARYRRVSATNGELEITSFRYDANNNVVRITEPNGAAWATAFKYDELDALIAVDERPRSGGGTPAGVARFFYDPNRNLIAEQDPSGNLITSRYDALDRVTDTFTHTVAGCLDDQATRGSGGNPACGNETTALRWQFAYDPNGNRTRLVDARGQQVNYQYDHLNRIVHAQYSGHVGPTLDFQTQSLSFGYDGNGNRDSVTEVKTINGVPATEITQRSFDALDRVKAATRRDHDAPVGKRIEYRYDRQGNRTQMTDPDGLATDYTYDARDRLMTMMTAAGLVRYTYWDNGLLKMVEYPNGVLRDYSDPAAYDRANRIRKIVNRRTGSAQPAISTYSYTYDKNGNPVAQAETQQAFNGGATDTTTYTYDRLNRLSSVAHGPGPGLTYTYEASGNRVTEKGTDPATGQQVDLSYRYEELPGRSGVTFNRVNALSQIVDNLNAAQTVTIEYDRNLNTIARERGSSRTEFAFGIRDRMVSAGPAAGARTAYDYDADGWRVKKRTADKELRFLYDGSTQVLDYGSGPTFATSGKYEYGDVLIASTAVEPSQRRVRFHTIDALGSTTNLTDGSAVVQSYRYDAWGGVRNQEGSVANARQYSGHYKDDETGLLYFGARYYDPDTGRFLSPDPGQGDPAIPITRQRYLYASANPARFIDRQGYESAEANSRCIGELCRQADGTWVSRGDEVTFADDRNPCAGVKGRACNPRTKEVDDYVAGENARYLARARAEIQPLKESLDRALRLRADYYRFVDSMQREEQVTATAEREALLAAMDEASSGGFGDMAMFFVDRFAEAVHEGGHAANMPTLGNLLATTIHTAGALVTGPMNFGAGAGAVTGKLQTGQAVSLEDAVMLAGDILTVADLGFALYGSARSAVVRDARAILADEFAGMASELGAARRAPVRATGIAALGADVLQSAGRIIPTGNRSFDLPAIEHPAYGDWRDNMLTKGFRVTLEPLPTGTAAQVTPGGFISLDPTQATYLDLLHETRHVAQLRRAQAAGIEVRWNTAQKAWFERGAYQYELRVANAVQRNTSARRALEPFSDAYRDFAKQRMKDYWNKSLEIRAAKSNSFRQEMARLWK